MWTLGCGNMNFGYAIVSTNSTWESITLQIGQEWTQDGTNTRLSVLNALTITGLTLGSFIGGSVIKYGRRRTIILNNVIAIIGACVSFIKVYEVIVLGRFLVGFAGGMIVSAAPKMLEETSPKSILDKGFGTTTNTLINVAFMISFFTAYGLADTKEELAKSDYWRVIYGLPIPFSLISILLLMTVHRQDSLIFLV